MLIKIKEKSFNEYWRRSSRTTWCIASESLFQLSKHPTDNKMKKKTAIKSMCNNGESSRSIY